MDDVIEKLCKEPLWNRSVSWDSNNPNLSKCMRHTVLIWIPYLFLFFCSSFEILRLICRGAKWTNKVDNTSKLFQTRLSLIAAMTCLLITEICTSYYSQEVLLSPMDYLYFIMFTAMLILESCTVYIERHVARKVSSSFQLLFWLITTVCLIPSAKVAAEEFIVIEEPQTSTLIVAICQILELVVGIILLLLEVFPYRDSPVNSEDSASFVSLLMFSWMSPVFKLGFEKKVLDPSHFPSPGKHVQLDNILNRFQLFWTTNKGKRDIGRKTSIFRILSKAYGPTFLLGAALKLLSDTLYYSIPQILRLFIREISNGEHSWRCYFWATFLFTVSLAQVTVVNQYFCHMYTIGIQMRTAMFSTIYLKSLKISAIAKVKYTTGEITNYISVDCQRFAQVVQLINTIWAGPMEITVAVGFLYEMVGVSAFVGLIILMLVIPVNIFSMKFAQKMERKLLKAKDKRIHLLNEALLGIKALKLYAWELPFLKQLFKIREKEVGYLKNCAIFWTNMNACFGMCPIIVTLVTFATYVYIDPTNNILTAEKVFACMALFNMIRIPMYQIPVCIMDVIKLFLSIRRIDEFLNCEEISPGVICKQTDSVSNSVELHGASLVWNQEQLGEPTLEDINLSIKAGSLVAVLGRVGAGKSSLLSGLLGEMELTHGRICIHGDTAFVPQQAWIQNLSLKDNILFGRTLDQAKYQSSLFSCALLADLQALPAGDMTEIGENGVNLSGGQKQRVSLARATYGEEEVLLLDDPLSAVDAHVAEHIFTHCIGPKGVLANRTRILVTHNLSFLDQMDRIILIEDGKVVGDGSYEELTSSNDKFKLYIQSIETAETSEDNDKPEKPPKMLEDALEQIQEDASIGEEKEDTCKLVSKEVSSTGRVDIRHYLHLIKKANVYLSIFIALMPILSNACHTYESILLSEWTDKMSKSAGMFNAEEFTSFLLLLGGVIFLQAVFVYMESIGLFRRCAHASGIIHNEALEAVFHSPMQFFDANPTGRILNRFSSDIDVLDQKIPREISDGWYCSVTVMILLCMTAYVIPIILVFLLPMMIMGGFIQVYYARTKRQLQRIESVNKSPIFSFFSETMQGISVIRAFGAQERFYKEYKSRLDIHLGCSYINMIGARWLSTRIDFLGTIMVFLIGILTSYYAGSISPGITALLVVFSITILESMGFAVRIISDLESDSVALERLREYEGLQEEGEWFSADSQEQQCLQWRPLDGSISFVDYSTRYREGLGNVLNGLTLDIADAEKIGICGRTGAGKSSLTLALFRIIEPVRGKIFIAGRDITTIGLQELRSQVTIIPQDPVLFSGSLRFNLDPTDSYSDAEVWDALKHAHLEDLVNKLEAGLGHEVGEGGRNFSVGERQLICLARALLRKTRILVLDEATAAMDSKTDENIQRTIAEEFKCCTVLTIAHRLNTILKSDRIVVLDQGRMVECGRPADLLEDKQTNFFLMCANAGIV